MAVGRTLRTTLRLGLVTKYRITDVITNPQGINDDLRYSDINHIFTDGVGGPNLNDLQYHKRIQQISSTVDYNLDDGTLKNQWGDALNFDAVKLLVLRNRETDITRFMDVTFKDEKYNIGALGSRILVEPSGPGTVANISTTPGLEGVITIITNSDITFDLIIIGSSQESISSSGM